VRDVIVWFSIIVEPRACRYAVIVGLTRLRVQIVVDELARALPSRRPALVQWLASQVPLPCRTPMPGSPAAI